MINFLASRGSLKLTGKDKKIIQKKAGEVYKLFNFFFGSGKLMGRFITKKSYVVCPFSHRFWENAFLNKEVYSSFKFRVPNFVLRQTEDFFKVKFQSFFNYSSTPHGRQGEIFFRYTKSLLDLIKSFSNVFWNRLLVINRRWFGNYRNSFYWVTLALCRLMKEVVLGSKEKRLNPKNNAITIGTLSGNCDFAGALWGLAWGSPRGHMDAYKANFPVAIGTSTRKTEHWG